MGTIIKNKTLKQMLNKTLYALVLLQVVAFAKVKYVKEFSAQDKYADEKAEEKVASLKSNVAKPAAKK